MKTMLSAIVVLGVLTGCGGPAGPAPSATGNAPAGGAGEKVPESLILTAAPAGAMDVGAAKKEVKDGETVVLRGRVGGKEKDVFTPGYAAFYLADMKLTPCNEKPGDNCPTPWDFCCDERDVILANLVNVEVQGADKKPLKLNLKGVQGIDHLSVLVVKGKAVKKDGDQNVTLIADGIFVEKAGLKK